MYKLVGVQSSEFHWYLRAQVCTNAEDWQVLNSVCTRNRKLKEKGLNECGGSSRSFQDDGWLQPVL